MPVSSSLTIAAQTQEEIMTNNADAIVIGSNGSVSVAPKGTTLPVDISTSLDPAFVQAGFLSEDGVKVADSKTVESVSVWQSLYPVRRFNTEKEFTVELVFREWNGVTVPLAFGGGEVTGATGKYRYDPPAPEVLDERAVVIDWIDGTRHSRLVIARCLSTETVESTIARSGPADLPVTLSALANDVDLPWYLLFDDEVFAPLP